MADLDDLADFKKNNHLSPNGTKTSPHRFHALSKIAVPLFRALYVVTKHLNGHTEKVWQSYQTNADATDKSVKTIQREVRELETKDWLARNPLPSLEALELPTIKFGRLGYHLLGYWPPNEGSSRALEWIAFFGRTLEQKTYSVKTGPKKTSLTADQTLEMKAGKMLRHPVHRGKLDRNPVAWKDPTQIAIRDWSTAGFVRTKNKLVRRFKTRPRKSNISRTMYHNS